MPSTRIVIDTYFWRNNKSFNSIKIWFIALWRNKYQKSSLLHWYKGLTSQLGSQAFIPMKQTTFLVLVAPEGNKPDLNRIEAFIVPPEIGVNYNPGTWHFPLIATEDMNFLVVDRKGSAEPFLSTTKKFISSVAIRGKCQVPGL